MTTALQEARASKTDTWYVEGGIGIVGDIDSGVNVDVDGGC